MAINWLSGTKDHPSSVRASKELKYSFDNKLDDDTTYKVPSNVKDTFDSDSRGFNTEHKSREHHHPEIEKASRFINTNTYQSGKQY